MFYSTWALCYIRHRAALTSSVRVLTNDRTPFFGVSGNIQWGRISGSEAEQIAGELVFNNEEEIHAPTLTVYQTLDTALVSY
jgi:ATP-binding cassette subfamily G (WHITE) protein 2 (SNQ2)